MADLDFELEEILNNADEVLETLDKQAQDKASKNTANSYDALDALETARLEQDVNPQADFDMSVLGSMDGVNKAGEDIKESNINLYKNEEALQLDAFDAAITRQLINSESPDKILGTAAARDSFLSSEDTFDTLFGDLVVSQESNAAREFTKDVSKKLSQYANGVIDDIADLKFEDAVLSAKAVNYAAITTAKEVQAIADQTINNIAQTPLNLVLAVVSESLNEMSKFPNVKGEVNPLNIDLTIKDNLFPVVGEGPKTGVGKAVSDILPMFVGGFTTLKALMASPKFAVLSPFKQGAAVGFITEGLFNPGNLGRIADIFEEFGMSNTVTEYLATDPNDSVLESRWKSTLEGGPLGIVLGETLHGVLRGYKSITHKLAELSRYDTMDALTKAIGPSKTSALINASPESVDVVIPKLKRTHPEEVEKIAKIVKGRKDAVSRKIEKAINNDPKRVLESNVVEPSQSSMAAVAKTAVLNGDNVATDNVLEGVGALIAPGKSPTKAIVEQAAGVGDALPLALIPDNAGTLLNNSVDHPLTTLEKMVNNAVDINPAASWDVSEALINGSPKYNRFQEINNTHIYRRSDGVGELDYGDYTTRNFEVEDVSPVLEFLQVPPNKFFGKSVGGLVDKPTADMRAASRLRQGFQRQQKLIYEDLSSTERRQLDHITQTANDLEENVKMTKDGLLVGKQLYSVSDSVVEAYALQRKMLDTLHALSETAARSKANVLGYKVLNDTDLVLPSKANFGDEVMDVHGNLTTYTKEHAKHGARVYASVYDDTDDLRIMVQESELTRVGDIPKDFPLTGYKTSWSPIDYTDKHIITTVKTDSNGLPVSAKTTHTADTAKEAQELVLKLSDIHQDSKFIATRNSGGVAHSAVKNDYAFDLKRMSTEQREVLEKVLKQNPDWTDDQIDDFFTARRRKAFTDSKHHQRRGKRLESSEREVKDPITGQVSKTTDAPIEMSQTAIAKATSRLSDFIETSEHIARLQKQFTEDFGDLLSVPGKWSSSLMWVDKADEGARLLRAASIQSQIKRVASIKSPGELVADGIANNQANKIIQTTGTEQLKNKTTQFVTAPFLKAWELGRTAKNVAGQTLLGAFSFGQIPLQLGGQMVVTIGRQVGRAGKGVVKGVLTLTDPTVATRVVAKGNKDFMRVLVPKMWDDVLTPVSKAGRDLERSGFVAELDFETLKEVSQSMNIKEMGGAFKNFLGKVGNAGIWPFKTAESIQRSYAWFVERQFVIDQVKRGKHPSLTIKDLNFKRPDGTVGLSDRALDEINTSADVTALNFTKANQPWMARGLQSTPLQFMQIFPQYTRSVLNFEKMPANEILGIWLTLGTVFGPKSIPFGEDILVAAEDAAIKTLNRPDLAGKYTYALSSKVGNQISEFASKIGVDISEETSKRYLSGGMLDVTLESDRQLSSRWALNDAFDQFYTNSSAASKYGGPAGALLEKFIETGYTNVETLVAAISEDGFEDAVTSENIFTLGTDFANIPPGTRSLLQTYKGMKNDVIRDHNTGKKLVDEPEPTDLLAHFLSFKPKNFMNDQDWKKFKKRNMEVWSTYIREEAKTIAKLKAEGNKRIAMARYRQTRKYVQEFGSTDLVLSLATMTMNKEIETHLTPEQLKVLRVHENFKLHQRVTKMWGEK